MAESLTVRVVGDALVYDYVAMEAGAHRFIGRTYLSTKDAPELGPAGGWVANEEESKVPVTPEYLKCLRDGSLIACNEETAKAAGIEFDAKALREEAEGAKEFWAVRKAAEAKAKEEAEAKAKPVKAQAPKPKEAGEAPQANEKG